MADTNKLVEWVEAIQRDGVNLSAWEEEFIDSMVTKIERYGDRTMFSEKQAEIIERVYTHAM